MGSISAMLSSYNSNSRRVKKPTYFESADVKKLGYTPIRKKKASIDELAITRTKMKRQNAIENTIIGVIVIGIMILTWVVFN